MKSNPDDIFRRVPAVPGLEVTRDGKFRLNGRPRKAIFGKKRYGNGLATVRFHWLQLLRGPGIRLRLRHTGRCTIGMTFEELQKTWRLRKHKSDNGGKEIHGGRGNH